jgi:hypothetical protein
MRQMKGRPNGSSQFKSDSDWRDILDSVLRLLKTARRSGPFLLVTYQYCSFARAALWDFWYPCRESGFAGRVSDRHLAVDLASGPVLDSADRVGFGSSCCFLSWNVITTEKSLCRSDKTKAAIRVAATM